LGEFEQARYFYGCFKGIKLENWFEVFSFAFRKRWARILPHFSEVLLQNKFKQRLSHSMIAEGGYVV
jgi:hypothetical protein